MWRKESDKLKDTKFSGLTKPCKNYIVDKQYASLILFQWTDYSRLYMKKLWHPYASSTPLVLNFCNSFSFNSLFPSTDPLHLKGHPDLSLLLGLICLSLVFVMVMNLTKEKWNSILDLSALDPAQIFSSWSFREQLLFAKHLDFFFFFNGCFTTFKDT